MEGFATMDTDLGGYMLHNTRGTETGMHKIEGKRKDKREDQ